MAASNMKRKLSSRKREVACSPSEALGWTLGQEAKTITWKITFYSYVISKDGLRRWLRADTRSQAFKAPGLYRDTTLDESEQVRWALITDMIAGEIHAGALE